MTPSSTDFRQHAFARRLASLRALYTTLPPLDPAQLVGVYLASFTGPTWLRSLAPRALWLGGLGGWLGKEFDAAGGAVNLVRRADSTQKVLPMRVEARPSLIDGQTGATLVYPRDVRFPWPWVVDELRAVDETTLLGLTLVNHRALRALAAPFWLRRF